MSPVIRWKTWLHLESQNRKTSQNRAFWPAGDGRQKRTLRAREWNQYLDTSKRPNLIPIKVVQKFRVVDTFKNIKNLWPDSETKAPSKTTRVPADCFLATMHPKEQICGTQI